MEQTRKTAAEDRQKVLMMERKDSCPAVSQIFILTLLSSSRRISLEQNSTPRVAVHPSRNSSLVNRLRRQLLPTPGGPITIILKAFSYYLRICRIISDDLMKYKHRCSYCSRNILKTNYMEEEKGMRFFTSGMYLRVPMMFLLILACQTMGFSVSNCDTFRFLPYIQMIASLQKRRNQSNESPHQNKFYLKRQHGSSALFNYSLIAPLKDRLPNRTINTSETEQNLLRKKGSPQRFNRQMALIQDKFSSFSSKIKVMLRGEHEESKENLSLSIYSPINMSTSMQGLNHSVLLRKERQEQRQQKQPFGTPYFIECLRRKSHISTEACMHIHTSILTFKQYLKSVQLTKAKTPDPRYALQIEGRKTVVFDMDETLIHTNETMVKGYELKVPFKSVQNKVISGYVHVRPYTREIIKNMSKHFDVIVFTAGNQCYADPILDSLDPEHCIKHRLYRESCTMVNCQLFVKDLRILGRPLESVVLVDNAPYSYMMQLSNGIPILNYLRGRDDDQLLRLEEYLMGLLKVDDVRTVNEETFRLKDYIHYDSYEKLAYALYAKWI